MKISKFELILHWIYFWNDITFDIELKFIVFYDGVAEIYIFFAPKFFALLTAIVISFQFPFVYIHYKHEENIVEDNLDILQ
jgi:hypothetical protein